MVTLILSLAIYVLACRFAMRQLSGLTRELAFAGLNLFAVFGFLFYGQSSHYVERFVIYLVLIVFQYVMLRIFADKKGWLPWLAFFTPIAALIVFRYIPGSVYVEIGHFLHSTWQGVPQMIGISYLAFRSSRLVLEVRNGAVKMPNFWEYLNFCFFLPTMPVGPINTYENYRLGFKVTPLDFPIPRCAMRILVGFIKYYFLGALCNQLSYSGLLLDDHPHHLIDLPIACLFFYLYLYCNFSGFCDMAIGAAGLIGIPVPENFQDPFHSRNMREFWNRWHITLSQYMRDVVFAPLSKYMARLLGPVRINLGVAITIMVVFLLMGIWHGPGWNYAVFGLLQGCGVITAHYYGLALKKWLGLNAFKAYMANRWIYAVAVTVTFCYYAITLFFFANSPEEMHAILSNLRY